MHSTMTLQTQKVLCITEALLVCPEPYAHEFGGHPNIKALQYYFHSSVLSSALTESQ